MSPHLHLRCRTVLNETALAFLACICWLWLFSDNAFAGNAGSDELSAVLARIKHTWQENEARFDSLRCRYQESILHLPGSIVIPQGPEGLSTGPQSEQYPSGWPTKALTIEAPHDILLSGDMMRNEQIMIGTPHSPNEEYYSAVHKSSYDGESSLTLGDYGSRGQLTKHAQKSNLDTLTVTWRPLRAIVRPLNPLFRSTDVPTLSVQSVDQSTQRAELWNASLFMKFTVDLSRDCLIVASSQTHPKTGNLLWDYDVVVEQDDEGHWIPEKWELRLWSVYGAHEVKSRYQATIEEFKYGQLLTKADFALEVPAELEVADLTTGLTGPDAITHYVAKETSSLNWKVTSIAVLSVVLCFWTFRVLKRSKPVRES